ncbi:hypothetical protein LEMLEM_LOCUS15252, partial [Lemmus lemmus]
RKPIPPTPAQTTEEAGCDCPAEKFCCPDTISTICLTSCHGMPPALYLMTSDD